MICKDCTRGAEAYRAGDPEAGAMTHADCVGGDWCDCQHVEAARA